MAIVQVDMRFAGAPPSAEDVRRRVAERTGLPVTLTSVEQLTPTRLRATLGHPEFVEDTEFSLFGDRATLTCGVKDQSYIMYQTLAAFRDLGATFVDGEPRWPAFIDKPWSERRWWQRWPR